MTQRSATAARTWLLALALTLLSLGCSSTHGGADDQEGNAASTLKGSIFVEVRDFDGRPAEGVTVRTDPSTDTFTTDDTGTILISDIRTGVYRVIARHDVLGVATAAAQVSAGEVFEVTLRLDNVPDDNAEPPWGYGDSGVPTGGSPDGGSPMTPKDPYIDVGTQVEAMLVDPKRPYLYALDKVNNALVFVNTDSKRVTRSVFVGSQPVDLDLSADGNSLFIANFGSTEIAVVDLDAQSVARSIFVQTKVGTWDGNPYRLAVLAFDTLAFTSEDQWNDIKLVRASDGVGLTATGSVYEPDLAASPDGTHLYVAESGSTGSGLKRYDVNQTGLTQVDESSTASGYGSRKAVVTPDGKYVFYAGQKFLASNLKNVLGTFNEAIYATNQDGTIAVGNTSIFNGTTFAIRRPLPIATTTLALDVAGKRLYLYEISKSRIYIHDVSDLY